MSIPVCYIAYSRIDKCKQTLEALCECIGIEDTEIFIFSDAPHNSSMEKKVKEVRFFLQEFIKENDLLNIHLIEHEKNKGSFRTIVDGLQYVLQDSESVILVEEDVLVGKSFLIYMNQALNFYRNDAKVFCVSGYNPVRCMKSSGDVFLSERLCCFGLGIWKDRFVNVCWNKKELPLNTIDRVYFNRIAKDISACFWDDLHKKTYFETSWDIVLFYNMLLKDKRQVIPIMSYCTNIGFDGSGEWSTKGCFINNNFIQHYIKTKFKFGSYYLAPKEQDEYFRGFIQDNFQKKLLRIGRIGASIMHLESVAEKIKRRLFVER